MKITNVRVKLINTDGKLKAVGSITIEDAFVIHDVRVLEGEKGLFVAMPSKKMTNGVFRDIAHPINSEARALIDAKVIEEYNRALEESLQNGEEI